MDKKTSNLNSNPFFLMVAMGIGAVVIIAITIAATKPHIGEPVGANPVPDHNAAEEAPMAEEAAADESAAELDAAEEEGTVAIEEEPAAN